ncbi:MAG TPA: hypothetical protein ENK57_14385 [Polyangiaceae bacterium]|nr:hypothetical protein [Polyangiaceae bacterium]
MRRALMSLALAFAALWCARPEYVRAQAGQRAIVQRFRGPRAAGLRRRLIDDLQEHGVTVVEEEEVRAARRRLGFGRRLRGDQYTQLGRELHAHVFIDGRVRRRRRRWSLTVRVRNARDGEQLGTGSWAGRTARALQAIGRNGYRRLSRHIARGETAGAQATPVPDGEVPWWQRRDVEDTTESPPEDEDPEEAAPRETSTRYDAMRLSLLGGTLFRSMQTTASVYASQRGIMPTDPATATIDEQRSYQSNGIGHFEIGGRLELYPGAFDEQQGFPFLGIILQFTHSAGVQTNGFNETTGDPVTVPTNQLDFFVGARLRYRFGPARREPEFHLDAGWGAFNFSLGLDELRQIQRDTIIPPMQHGYFQAALGIEYGVVPTYLTLGLEVGARVGTNIGGDTRNVWGVETAASNGFLLGANMRVEIPEIVQGAFLGLNVQYFLFVTDFQGQVGCAVAEECAGFMDPWSDTRLWEVWPVASTGAGPPDLDAVVGGPSGPVVDNYVRLQLAIGYAFY